MRIDPVLDAVENDGDQGRNCVAVGEISTVHPHVDGRRGVGGIDGFGKICNGILDSDDTAMTAEQTLTGREIAQCGPTVNNVRDLLGAGGVVIVPAVRNDCVEGI